MQQDTLGTMIHRKVESDYGGNLSHAATAAGVSRQTLRSWMHDYQIPKPSKMDALAEWLGVRPLELLMVLYRIPREEVALASKGGGVGASPHKTSSRRSAPPSGMLG